MPIENQCGCKGIRSCLVCEEQSAISVNPIKTEENHCIYNYCCHCNLCWPDDETTASACDFPLYLGKIKLIPEFCTKEEESTFTSFIDKIPWMPSQSGRRKQDFGPKVNFKKKKVKIGEFKGFPKFAEKVIKKLKELPELSNFDPVELCNLEYIPERGSSIDPHVDDFWLWGERLVTVNLNSTTILTLEPCSEIACECFKETDHNYFHLTEENFNEETNSCKHLFQNGSVIKSSTKFWPKNYSDTACKSDNLNCDLLKTDVQKSELDNVILDDKENSFLSAEKRNNCKEVHYTETYTDCDTENISASLKYFEISNMQTTENKIPTANHDFKITDNKRINLLCNSFRTCSSSSKVCVRIVLPPRSLFILAGCARYNWSHEIKRQDVVSRRLAMTFRELSTEFLDEGKESQCGKNLLLIAKNFYDL